ncbi:hypothetical protein AURDEDRAFT_156343 [Auricularia subglabra TFB-10046 SS5]|nr:hypothetical protein AURDEDRAFT_156343 [Auricularia subglabra TFB-10046 SS5]
MAAAAAVAGATVLAPQNALDAYETIMRVRMFYLSGLCLLVWDYLLTFDMELRYFWKRGLRRREHSLFLFVLFMMNRYLPILTQILNTVGVVWTKHVTATVAIMEWYAIPAAVVCYRTCALYGRRTRVICGLIGAYIATLAAVAIVVVISLARDTIVAEVNIGSNLHFRACHSTLTGTSTKLYAVFIPPLIYELAISVAAIVALRKLNRRALADHRIFRAMAWHSVAYCSVIAIAITINMIIYARVTSAERHIFDGIMFALISISCSRLLLHLRELGDDSGTDFFAEQTASDRTLASLRTLKTGRGNW